MSDIFSAQGKIKVSKSEMDKTRQSVEQGQKILANLPALQSMGLITPELESQIKQAVRFGEKILENTEIDDNETE